MLNVTLILAIFAAPMTDEVENLEYKNWSKFKPGSSVTMSMVTEAAGQKTEMISVTTLKSVADAELVLETKMTMHVAGQKIDQPAQDRKVPAKLPKMEMPATDEKEAPKPKTEEGTGDIEVAGKKLACKFMKTTMDTEMGKSISTIWLSDAIPGGTAKMESTMEGQMSSKSIMMVTAFETK